MQRPTLTLPKKATSVPPKKPKQSYNTLRQLHNTVCVKKYIVTHTPSYWLQTETHWGISLAELCPWMLRKGFKKSSQEARKNVFLPVFCEPLNVQGGVLAGCNMSKILHCKHRSTTGVWSKSLAGSDMDQIKDDWSPLALLPPYTEARWPTGKNAKSISWIRVVFLRHTRLKQIPL